MHKREMTVFGKAPKPKSWYRFEPKAADDVAEILIYDEISFWGVDAGAFNADLAQVTASTINLRINSPGGSVFDGVAIYNALKGHGARVNVTIDGLAASIASVIALAGDRVTMGEGSFMMIHDPWALAIGNAADMRETADVLEKIGGSMADIYTANSDMSRADVLAAMADETWYTAPEAVDVGLADETHEGAEASASFDLSIYSRVPDALRVQAGRRPETPQTPREFEKFLRDAGFDRARAKAVTSKGFGVATDQWDVDDPESAADLDAGDAAAMNALIDKLRSIS